MRIRNTVEKALKAGCLLLALLLGWAAAGPAAIADTAKPKVTIRNAGPFVPAAEPEASPAQAVQGQAVPTVKTAPEEPAAARTQVAIRRKYPLRSFDEAQDYVDWAYETGYRTGAMVPQGASSIGYDYFHTLPGEPAYRSGRIVIGDSRCCQLGIYALRSNRKSYAVYAVWGGHYTSGLVPPVLTDKHLQEIEACFQEQIRVRGFCKIFFFATVNDFDFHTNHNEQHIQAALSAAERIASLSCEQDGEVFHPQVYVIGFAGGRNTGSIVSVPHAVFNRYCGDYCEKLHAAVDASALLRDTAPYYTAVPEIVQGEVGFIDDGLHYDDQTLDRIVTYINTL